MEEEVQGSEPTSDQQTPIEGSIEEQQAVSEESVQDSPTEQQTEVGTEVPTSPETPLGQQMDVDEMGVPYKNRYMESQRKLDKMAEQLNAVAEKVNQPQGQKRNDYTVRNRADDC